MLEQDKYYSDKSNKSFARRVGRKLTNINQKILEEKLPIHLYNKSDYVNSEYQDKYLEIGFGMGEHFVSQSDNNQNALYVGAEVYINGVANALKLIDSKNFMIWPDDANIILDDIPTDSLSGIYMLFPDPWHKRRFLPRRLFNKDRLDKMKSVLKHGGFISFASDIEDYFMIVRSLLEEDDDIIITNSSHTTPHPGYIETKYHKKAIKEGRIAQFITGILK